jgi:ABC-2 type transport system ATP-binding protein
MTAISATKLSRRYGDLTVLDRVDLDVPTGQLIAVLGPNGAGKTTLIEILEGLAPPSGGTVRVLGEDPRRADRRWRGRIGLMLQSTSLENESTVREILSLAAGLYPDPRPVAEVLELIDLTGDARSRIGTLSGGQQRRVDLGLAVIGRPDVLFLDEPTTGLDPQARQRCWSTVARMRSDGATVVLTSHYLDEVEQLADRVVVLNSGRVVADTDPVRLRTQAGASRIRFRIPDGAAELPAGLTRQISSGTLRMTTADPTAALGELVRWAERNQVELSGLEIGPPTLESAYLNLIGAHSDA